MKLELDMPRKEWKVLQEELEYHMGHMGVPASKVDPWQVFYKVTEAIKNHYETHRSSRG